MAPAKDHAPRKPRYSVTLTASARRVGQQNTTGHRIRNLSADGACVQGGDVFAVGETLIVSVGDMMAIEAEVRWVADGLAGMKFARSINIADALGRAARPPKMPKSSLWNRAAA